jgi:heme-degrading monooxygenase HmoA
MFVVIYHWKLKSGRYAEFREAWRQATEAIYAKRGSLGSQLMQSNDRTYYAVARWPERDQWVNRSQPEAADPQAMQTMGGLIKESFPPVELEVTDDMLALEPHS